MPDGTSLAALVAVSQDVASTRSRLRKTAALAALLRGLHPTELRLAIHYLSGDIAQGRIGIGWATVRELEPGGAAAEPTLSLLDVDRALGAIAAARGGGSAGQKKRILGELLARATAAERHFLAQLLLGELRQGALLGVMLDAVASAFDLPADRVRRAAMLAGSIAEVADAVKREGPAGLDAFSLTLFRPVLPMLASPVDDLDAALDRLGEAALELKLDGARIQVHRAGDDVRIYSRGLKDVTDRVPEIVRAVRALPARELILDGEAIALREDGTPLPFQTTMRRFGRTREVTAMEGELPLRSLFFDCIRLDGRDLVGEPLRARSEALVATLPDPLRIERLVTSDAGQARAFWARALELGHEGLMAKSLDAAYEAGSRGFSWLKVKPAHTLDLVVLAVEEGSGRRRGFLSNIHLGARDPRTGGFVMLGKTFKGMTDQMLAWQTEQLSALAVGREGHVVHVRPELVAEVAFSDVQASPHYPAGLALRFARVKRYRPDKRAEDADTIDTVRAIHDGAIGHTHPPTRHR